MKILQIVGTKKSGKTSSMLDFIRLAKSMGMKVACLKRAHEAVMDTPETDSFLFAEAGADSVGLQTAGEFLLHEKKSLSLLETIERYVDPESDLLLIEGFRSEKFPRLQLLKADEEQLDADFYASLFPERLSDDLLDFTDSSKRKEWFQKWLMN